ncbi:tRNA methyltransferase 61 [Arctopsyche grandis]|uniref:tRNA methyltransferase 61 n=1 Tax=Arctopsyche grandis TaxID=121162 RepID=UPI00406D707B
MSFNYKETIEVGDTVILYMSNTMHAIDVHSEIKNKKGTMVENVFQTTFGALKVKNLIGKKYGSKVELSKGWAHVLLPTPELWTVTLPHRTQIIYTPDISMIVMQLEICPGSIIIEAGTGSGSLSHAFIRAVKPTGHLYTFDFHENRVMSAKEEFSSHGLADFVTAQHRDVCNSGFGDSLDGKADAVFLDLPHPWLGVPFATKSLKSSGGRFCSFSPCIEQVQRTCSTLTDSGFQELKTLEVLQTEYKIASRPISVRELDFIKLKKSEDINEKPSNDVQYITATAPLNMPGHTGYLTFATLPPVWARNSVGKPRADADSENIDETAE